MDVVMIDNRRGRLPGTDTNGGKKMFLCNEISFDSDSDMNNDDKDKWNQSVLKWQSRAEQSWETYLYRQSVKYKRLKNRVSSPSTSQGVWNGMVSRSARETMNAAKLHNRLKEVHCI